MSLRSRVVTWVAQRKLKEILAMPQLSGSKTYLAALAYALLVFLQGAGLVPEEWWGASETLKQQLLAAQVIFLRMGVKKAG